MKRVFWSSLTMSLFGTTVLLFQPTLTTAQDKTKSDTIEQESTKSKTSDVAAGDEKTAAAEKKKIETVSAEKKPLIAYESFGGVFESTRTHEVKTDFENWTDLVIESVVEEGVVVAKGEQLLKFDTEAIDKAVAEAEFAFKNAEFEVKTAELTMKQANETFELDRAGAERAWKNAKEDYDYYLQTQLPNQVDDLEFGKKTAGYYLEYSKDELDQLEKMYTEDELTEESEAIVLKRAQRDVESASRSLDRTLTRLAREEKTEIPREKIQQEDSLKRAEMTYARAMITLPIAQQKAEIALAQAEFALKDKRQALTDLQTDQGKMVLLAPEAGIAYYGSCDRGKWSGPAGAGTRQLEPEKKLSAKAVVMTIVDIEQMMIRANLAEANLNSLAPRARGKAMVTAAGNTTLPVLIKSISRIPLDDNKFDCQIAIEKLPVELTVMPGMACKLSFQVYANEQALVLPKTSVFSDDDGVTNYVYLVQDDQSIWTEVTIGRTVGETVEILDGLTAGALVAKAKP